MSAPTPGPWGLVRVEAHYWKVVSEAEPNANH